MFLVPGGPAPGGPGPAPGRVRLRVGRWRHGDVGALLVRGVQPPAGPVAGRPLQGVRCVRRRHGVGRRRRNAAAEPVVRGAQRRASGAGRGARLGDQPGRGEQRADRTARTGAAAGDPAGARGRGARARGHRRGGGARHRHPAGGRHRGGGLLRDVRAAGPAGSPPAGLGEVEHRSYPGRRRSGRSHQDGAGDAARGAAAYVARRRADAPGRLVVGADRAADPGGGVARDGPSAPGGGVVVRDQWHQRPCGTRRGPGRRGGGTAVHCGGRRGDGDGGGGERPCRARGGAGACGAFRAGPGGLPGVGEERAGAAGPGATAPRPCGRHSRRVAGGHQVLARHHACGPGAPGRGGGPGPCRAARFPAGRGGGRRPVRGAHGHVPSTRFDGLPVHRSGQSAGRHGARVVRVAGSASGVRPFAGRVLCPARPAASGAAAGRHVRRAGYGEGRVAGHDPVRTTGALRPGDGPVPAVRGMGCAPARWPGTRWAR